MIKEQEANNKWWLMLDAERQPGPVPREDFLSENACWTSETEHN